MSRRPEFYIVSKLFCFVFLAAACAPFPDGPPDSPASAGSGELIPSPEPKSRQGNPPFYDAFGERYYILETNEGYVERGVASWYGRKFHGRHTANGEVYDMYAMTAAHKTLPLPTWARVTNLRNGKSVVVRVNDRGPFIHNRLIDLSWSAAEKLNFAQQGTTLVEIRALNPGSPDDSPPQPVTTEDAPLTQESGNNDENRLYVQVGAFSEFDNASRMRKQLEQEQLDNVLIQDASTATGELYKVRVGPLSSVDEFDHLVGVLKELGIHDTHLAIE